MHNSMRFLPLIAVLCWSAAVFGTSVSNLSFDPSHKRLNNAGKVTLSFDVANPDDVEELYIELRSGIMYTKVPGTERDSSDLDATDNTIEITGEYLYEAVPQLAVCGVPYFAPKDGNVMPAPDDLMAEEDTGTDEVTVPDEDLLIADTQETADSAANSDTLTADADSSELLDNETPDESASYPSSRDGQYQFNLVVRLKGLNDNDTVSDHDTTDADTDTNDNDMAITPRFYTTEEKSSFELYLDNVPPQKPEKTVIEGEHHELRLTVTPSLKDALGKTGEQIGSYRVTVTGIFLYNGQEAETSLIYTAEVPSASAAKEYTFAIGSQNGYELINNDLNVDKYRYTLKINAVDQAGNYDAAEYLETTGSALTTLGFWSNYKQAGGGEDGGYCFIATATYGDYNHPNVRILRSFRDVILLTNEPGRAFVKAYYDNGWIIGKYIGQHPYLRPLLKLALMPWIILGAVLTSWKLLALFAFGFIVVMLGFRKTLPIAAVLLILPLNLAAVENNDDEELYSSSVKKEEKKKKEEKEEDKRLLRGEFAFISSFYDPSGIAHDATGNPVTQIAGDSVEYLPMLTGGIDIPAGKYLKLTARIGIGFVMFEGNGIRLDGSESTDRTYFHIIPVFGELKLRPVYDFPLRPFIVFGGDYNFWWIRENGELAEDGAKYGIHGSAGIEISLNWIDPKSAIRLRESTGITDTSLFAGYRLELINSFKNSGFDLSSNRVEFGIIFDF